MLANVVTDILTQIIWPLVQFLIGLGVVVFFHELGHFLAARWAGIRVERFAIGMGPRLCGVKKGDTDYCLCAIPLGGYVKMLGQEDFKPVEGEDAIDPNSFMAKSVGKRLVVISAGVVMNIILAAILFIIVGMVGKEDMAPVVGDVSPTFSAANANITWEPPAEAKDKKLTPPASEKGLQPGDRIVSINGEAVSNFSDVQKAALFGSKGETFDFVIQRDMAGVTWTGTTRIQVQFSPQQGVNLFGISSAMSLKIGENTEILRDTPFQADDVVKAINGKPIENQWTLDDIAPTLDGKDCTVAIQRDDSQDVQITVAPTMLTRGNIRYLADGKRIVGWGVEPPDDVDKDTAKITTYLKASDGSTQAIPNTDIVGGAVVLLDVLGMTPRTTVSAVDKGGVIFHSPAYKAGLQPGDIILSYADRPTPNANQFLQISKDIGNQPTNIVVQRGQDVQTLSITPADKDGMVKVGIVQGLDYAHPIIGSVRENSPAAKIGIEKGAEITAINNQKVNSWQDIVATLKKLAGQKVVLQGRVGTEEKTWDLGELTTNVFHPDDYEWSLLSNVPFEPEYVMIVHRNPFKAIAWGVGEAGRWIVLVYKSFGAILSGAVSPSKAVQGPIGIGAIAVTAARESFMHLVRLMALLSVALAVFNFLPIPVLDGGHALLLIIEKVRGKPLPLKFVNGLQMVFLFLIMGLFALICWNDIANLWQRLW